VVAVGAERPPGGARASPVAGPGTGGPRRARGGTRRAGARGPGSARSDRRRPHGRAAPEGSPALAAGPAPGARRLARGIAGGRAAPHAPRNGGRARGAGRRDAPHGCRGGETSPSPRGGVAGRRTTPWPRRCTRPGCGGGPGGSPRASRAARRGAPAPRKRAWAVGGARPAGRGDTRAARGRRWESLRDGGVVARHASARQAGNWSLDERAGPRCARGGAVGGAGAAAVVVRRRLGDRHGPPHHAPRGARPWPGQLDDRLSRPHPGRRHARRRAAPSHPGRSELRPRVGPTRGGRGGHALARAGPAGAGARMGGAGDLSRSVLRPHRLHPPGTRLATAVRRRPPRADLPHPPARPRRAPLGRCDAVGRLARARDHDTRRGVGCHASGSRDGGRARRARRPGAAHPTAVDPRHVDPGRVGLRSVAPSATRLGTAHPGTAGDRGTAHPGTAGDRGTAHPGTAGDPAGPAGPGPIPLRPAGRGARRTAPGRPRGRAGGPSPRRTPRRPSRTGPSAPDR